MEATAAIIERPSFAVEIVMVGACSHCGETRPGEHYCIGIRTELRKRCADNAAQFVRMGWTDINIRYGWQK